MKSFVISLLAAVAVSEGTGDVDFTSIGKFDAKHAAFLNVEKYGDSDEFLLLSAFSGSPLSHGSVSVVPGIKDAVTAGDVSSLKENTLDTDKVKF